MICLGPVCNNMSLAACHAPHVRPFDLENLIRTLRPPLQQLTFAGDGLAQVFASAGPCTVYRDDGPSAACQAASVVHCATSPSEPYTLPYPTTDINVHNMQLSFPLAFP